MRLAEVTRKYINSPYKLGSWDRDKGFDCIGVILSILKELDLEYPETFEGITKETYSDLWLSDPNKARKILTRFLLSLGNEIPKFKMMPKDILIVKDKSNSNMHFGIHAGNSQMLTSFTDAGVKLINLNHFEILKVIRWVP